MSGHDPSLRPELHAAVVAVGANATEIPRKEAWALLQAWREIYCAPVHAATGKWVIDGHSWHTFSRGFFPCLRGRRAFDKYLAQESSELLVLPEDKHCAAIRFTSTAAVDFSTLSLDLYVAPRSLEWTMVFTHEQSEYGPYFARSGARIQHDATSQLPGD